MGQGGNAPAVNPGATFFIPMEDQWNKTAYYKGGGTNAGYWDYATQNDTTPTAVTADGTGIGSAGSTGNFANYASGVVWNGQFGNVTTVDNNGGASAYGAFDMSGNVWEWNDLAGAADPSRGLRGGYWFSNMFLSSSFRGSFDPSIENNEIGFRLASPVSGPPSVPENDTNSLGSVLALVWEALGLLERRRLKVRLAA